MGPGNLSDGSIFPGEVAHHEVNRHYRGRVLSDKAPRWEIKFAGILIFSQFNTQRFGLGQATFSQFQRVSQIGMQPLIFDSAR